MARRGGLLVWVVAVSLLSGCASEGFLETLNGTGDDRCRAPAPRAVAILRAVRTVGGAYVLELRMDDGAKVRLRVDPWRHPAGAGRHGSWPGEILPPFSPKRVTVLSRAPGSWPRDAVALRVRPGREPPALRLEGALIEIRQGSRYRPLARAPRPRRPLRPTRPRPVRSGPSFARGVVFEAAKAFCVGLVSAAVGLGLVALLAMAQGHLHSPS